jgi:hypothetical protein
VLERYSMQVKQLLKAVLSSPGVIDPALREAIECFSAGLSDSTDVITREILPIVHMYLEKVTRHAYRVIEDDMERFQKAGYSEEAIFEITVSAALGAGMGRLELGLAALQEGGKSCF